MKTHDPCIPFRDRIREDWKRKGLNLDLSFSTQNTNFFQADKMKAEFLQGAS